MIHVISKLFSVTESCLGDSGWLLPERLGCYYAIKHRLTHCYTNMFLDFLLTGIEINFVSLYH